jgi:malate synthase
LSTKLAITGPAIAGSERVFTAEALEFVSGILEKFGPRRLALLAARKERDARIASGAERYRFLAETASVRGGDWKVAPCPADLEKRHVEITGPTERKMMINALNSGADTFMADFEDSLSPTWENIVLGQVCSQEAVRRTLAFTSPEGKQYKLGDKPCTLLIRPRGWHLTEKHAHLPGAPEVSGSLFDFGFYFFHNAKELLARGSGPYFYLPKMESHLEARLWNDVFTYAEKTLGVPHGSVRATVLIETFPAAFEMEEILFELREHASGLNAGRWDYLFSAIKKLRAQPGLSIPDRGQLTMTVPFMRAYTELLIKTCHTHGAHAMGGMAPFIPSRKNPEINEAALAKVREDKTREVNDGCDGTWVAHPDLVPTAKAVFDLKLGDKKNQKERLRSEVSVTAEQLENLAVDGGQLTEAGVRQNVSVAIQYLASWLGGNGAAAIFNLMEDAATAEISRTALWHQVKHESKLSDGRPLTAALYGKLRDEELARLTAGPLAPHLPAAVKLLDGLVLGREFPDFLTTGAYALLD